MTATLLVDILGVPEAVDDAGSANPSLALPAADVPVDVALPALAPSPSAATSPDFDLTRDFFAGCVGERRVGLLVGPLSPNPDRTMAATITAICEVGA